jgi:hypothetical protein
LHLAKRSSGVFASALLITSEVRAETAGFTVCKGCGSSDTIWCIRAGPESAANGLLPLSIW